MFKNTSGQKVRVYAVDSATGGPKTGDAANITVYLSKDRGTLTGLTDTSAAEVSSTNAPGAYECDVSQTESNCDIYDVTGASTTSGVVIVPILNGHTMPANFANRVIDSAGLGDSNIVKAAGVAWGSGAITAAALASGALTAAKAAADFLAAIRDKVFERTTLRGTVGTGSSPISVVTSAMSPATSAADQLKGQILMFDFDTTTAALRGQKTDITASTASATPTLTVTALTTAAVSGDTFTIG